MRKAFLLTTLITMMGFSVMAAESEFKFSLGGTVQYESPLLAGGEYNEDFAAENKEVGIDDFLLGLQLRADWKWDKVGLRLDLMTFYNPTGDYSGLSDTFSEALTTFDLAAIEDIEHGLKFVFNPMFHATGKFVSFSVGPGVTFGWNVSQGVDAIEAIQAGDSTAIDEQITRIGLDPATVSVTSADTLKENLSFAQQVAFYGGELDFNIKAGLDFMIGKLTIGVNYIWDLNADLAQWEEGGDFATNMENIIDIDRTVGMLGASILYSF